MEWHRLLIKKVTDREQIYLSTLLYTLLYNQEKRVMQLSRPRTENPISTDPPSIFSTVTDSLTNGYLAFAQANKLESTRTILKCLKQKES